MRCAASALGEPKKVCAEISNHHGGVGSGAWQDLGGADGGLPAWPARLGGSSCCCVHRHRAAALYDHVSQVWRQILHQHCCVHLHQSCDSRVCRKHGAWQKPPQQRAHSICSTAALEEATREQSTAVSTVCAATRKTRGGGTPGVKCTNATCTQQASRPRLWCAAHLLRAQIVHELVCFVHNLMLQQLLQHILYGDDPHGLIVVYAICPRCSWLDLCDQSVLALCSTLAA
jgi:hypothetical protein